MTNDFRPTTEAEKLEMKRKILYLANRMKCQYIDYGNYVAVIIRPMTMIKQEDGNGQQNTTETPQH